MRLISLLVDVDVELSASLMVLPKKSRQQPCNVWAERGLAETGVVGRAAYRGGAMQAGSDPRRSAAECSFKKAACA